MSTASAIVPPGFRSHTTFTSLSIAPILVLLCHSTALGSPMDADLAARAAARASPVSGAAPVLVQPSDMTLKGGGAATQTLHASDADGEPLTFLKANGPAYMNVTTEDPSAGSATGAVHLAPAPNETGSVTAFVEVSDGYLSDRKPFVVTVYPILDQPASILLTETRIEDRLLTATSSGNGPLTFSLVSGPSFMTVTNTSPTTGTAHIAPGIGDAGTYIATVAVEDGGATNQKTLGVEVYTLYGRPPVLEQPHDMHGIVGSTTEQALNAFDPDGSPLQFSKLAGPTFLNVDTVDRRGRVLVSPTSADTGMAAATVSVTDGVFADSASFMIHTDYKNNEPILSPIADVTLDEGMDLDQAFTVFDPDGQRLVVQLMQKPRFLTWGTTPQPIGSDSISGLLRLTPTYEDAGAYHATLDVWDGLFRIQSGFAITVREAYAGETSLRLSAHREGSLASPAEHEYSGADGTYAVASSNPGEVRFSFAMSTSAARWTVRLTAPVGFVLQEGSYSDAVLGGQPTSRPHLILSGFDPNEGGLSFCGQGSGSFEIKRLVRRVDNTILSLWATFEQVCSDTLPALQGEIRYNVPSIPITLNAPTWAAANTAENMVLRMEASDTTGGAITISVDGLPSGARFVDFGGGSAALGWMPTLAQVGDHHMTFAASSAAGLTDTVHTTIRVVPINHAPQALANGPYIGTVDMPLTFSSAGTIDVDGDPLEYLWNFGDGGTSREVSPSHIFALPGPYSVSLRVSDGHSSTTNYTLATLYEPYAGRVFRLGESSTLHLAAGSMSFCVGFEPYRRVRELSEIEFSGVRMTAAGFKASNAIRADSSSIALGDADRNGRQDLTLCFQRDDLRQLFEGAGTVSTSATIDVLFRDGHGTRGAIPIDVIGSNGGMSVLVTPNPMNPVGTFSFVTTQPGTARLRLYDVNGRLVRVLLEGERLDPGYHDLVLDGRAEDGTPLSSGIYLWRLETTERTVTGRVAIVK